MTDRILHYINDPLCGWCYAAEPLAEAAADAGIRVVLHGGGLWKVATHASDAKRFNMRDNDARIASLMGQQFGMAYLTGTLFDPATVRWSRPTIAAVLAAEAIKPGCGLAMMAAVQRAHYFEGQRVVETVVLVDLAAALSLEANLFAKCFASVSVDTHTRDTQALMRRHELRGFPSFLLEQDSGVKPIAHERFYGDPNGFVGSIARTGIALV